MSLYIGRLMGRPATKPATEFGRNLAQARQAIGLTQSQFAVRIGLTQQMVDYYERRARNPTADFIQKAAQILDITVDELLGVKPLRKIKPGPPSKLQQKLEQIQKLPPAKQQAIMQVLDMALASRS